MLEKKNAKMYLIPPLQADQVCLELSDDDVFQPQPSIQH